MDELTEATPRRTPSFHPPGGQSPRVGSCAGAFYHLIDLNLSKRFSSAKRIVADRPNQGVLYARRDGSFVEHRNITASKVALEDALSTLKNTPASYSTPSPASVKSDATSKRSPGVIARLMGLESLPERTHNASSKSGTPQDLHSDLSEQLGPPPVLLQELLRLELQHSKRSLKDRLPGFTKKPVDQKPGRGGVSQKKNPAASFGEHVRPCDISRTLRPSLRAVHEDIKEQPFSARLQQTGAPMLPSMPQNSSSPILSPSMLGGKNTVRLLEVAVKALEPVPRRKHSLPSKDSHRGTHSENGVSLRSEKKAFTTSSYGRGGSPRANSSSKSVRSQSGSRTGGGKDDRAVGQSGHESSSPGSRSASRARCESSRQAQSSRARYEATTSAASSRSVSPLQTRRLRTSTTRRAEDSPRALLRTYEASIRGFKTDLRTGADSSPVKKLETSDSQPQALELEVLSEKTPPAPSPNHDPTHVKSDSPEPCTPDQDADVKVDISQNSPKSMSKTVAEKHVPTGGFRSIRFRSRSGKQEKDVGGQGNRVSPSDKHPMEISVGIALPLKEAKVATAGFSYSMLFSSRKHGNKKEGNEKGEALVMKRTDSTWMRYLLRKPSNTPWTSKSSEKVDVEVERMDPVDGGAQQDKDSSGQEPALSPSQKELEKTKEESNFVVQAKYRSIDDVFPELPMEEKDASRPSPDLAKTIRAVEERFLGFESRGGDADYRSIERMFGKDFSRTLVAAPLTSPDMSPVENPDPETSPMSPEAECGVPGTFPNSPLVKYETGGLFYSRSQLNLHDMFEVVSGNCSHDSGRRRSFCFSEAGERVLDDEEAGAESDTCSNSATFDTVSTPERLHNHKMSVAARWNEGVMTPPVLKKFEEKLAHDGEMTPPALKEFEEKLAHDGVMTPPALKEFEEKLAHEGEMTPPALMEFEEKLVHQGEMTPPALKEFEKKLAHEGEMTPAALKEFEEKLAHDGVMTPPALKKFEEKLAQGFSDLDDSHVLCPDEFGQPSPVSVLQSPFLDEVPTTPDASLAELQLTDEHHNDIDKEPSALEDDEDQTQETNENMATSKVSEAAMPEIIQTDMIERAILDISRIRNIAVKSVGLEPQTIAPVEPQQEENYVREVLDAANLLREKESGCHSAASSVNLSLFNRLEFGSTKQRPSVRSERKLLFDSVNEVLAIEPWLRTSSFYVDLPMFPDLCSNSKFRSPIAGEALVTEVLKMICHWKTIAGNCLDDLIDYDMNVPEGRWVNFCHEVAAVGLNIERTLLKVLIKEVVDDLTSIVVARGVTTY